MSEQKLIGDNGLPARVTLYKRETIIGFGDCVISHVVPYEVVLYKYDLPKPGRGRKWVVGWSREDGLDVAVWLKVRANL